MSETAKRPLPNIKEADTTDFWAATKNQEFNIQVCANCGQITWYPRAHCAHCTDGDLQTKVVTGHGEVYSYSIVRQSYHPFFRNLVPYVVAWVDLAEGVRYLTNVVECAPEDVHVGMPVSIHWEAHEELKLPMVKPQA